MRLQEQICLTSTYQPERFHLVYLNGWYDLNVLDGSIPSIGESAVLFECPEDLPTLFPILFISGGSVCKEERLHRFRANIREGQMRESVKRDATHRKIFRPSIRGEPLFKGDQMQKTHKIRSDVRCRFDIPILLVFETILTLAEHDYLWSKSTGKRPGVQQTTSNVATGEKRTSQCCMIPDSCR